MASGWFCRAVSPLYLVWRWSNYPCLLDLSITGYISLFLTLILTAFPSLLSLRSLVLAYPTSLSPVSCSTSWRSLAASRSCIVSMPTPFPLPHPSFLLFSSNGTFLASRQACPSYRWAHVPIRVIRQAWQAMTAKQSYKRTLVFYSWLLSMLYSQHLIC